MHVYIKMSLAYAYACALSELDKNANQPSMIDEINGRGEWVSGKTITADNDALCFVDPIVLSADLIERKVKKDLARCHDDDWETLLCSRCGYTHQHTRDMPGRRSSIYCKAHASIICCYCMITSEWVNAEYGADTCIACLILQDDNMLIEQKDIKVDTKSEEPKTRDTDMEWTTYVSIGKDISLRLNERVMYGSLVNDCLRNACVAIDKCRAGNIDLWTRFPWNVSFTGELGFDITPNAVDGVFDACYQLRENLRNYTPEGDSEFGGACRGSSCSRCNRRSSRRDHMHCEMCGYLCLRCATVGDLLMDFIDTGFCIRCTFMIPIMFRNFRKLLVIEDEKTLKLTDNVIVEMFNARIVAKIHSFGHDRIIAIAKKEKRKSVLTTFRGSKFGLLM
jgi:hypothetical protein